MKVRAPLAVETVSGGAEIDAEVNARQAAEGGRDLKIARGLQYG